MPIPEEFPEPVIEACEQIWTFYRELGLDAMTDGTYDRNDFHLFLLTLGRMVEVFQDYTQAERQAIYDAFTTLAALEPDERERDTAFERVMDTVYPRDPYAEEP